MIFAVHPQCKAQLQPDCFKAINQGQLFLALERNPEAEVKLDPDLPGALRIEDVLEIIRSKYPNSQISMIETEPAIFSQQTCSTKTSKVALLIPGVLGMGFFLLFSKGSYPQQNVIIALSLFLSTSIAYLIQFISETKKVSN